MQAPPRFRWPYLLLAYGCVGIGAAGVAIPGLPTTPFLLIAAWAAGRGSPRLKRRLHEHPRFGPLLRGWEHERAIPVRAKWAAVLLLALSWVLLSAFSTHPLVPLLSGLMFIALAVFLLSRPSAGTQRPSPSAHPRNPLR